MLEYMLINKKEPAFCRQQNMKNKPLLNFFIARGAILYTCFSGIYFIISIFAKNSKLLEPRQFLSLLLFSYILSAGSTIYRFENISRTAKRCWHAVFFTGGFVIFLALCQVILKSILISTIVYIIVYTIFAIIAEIKYSRCASASAKKDVPAKKSKQEYQSIFSQHDHKEDKSK